MDSFQNLPSLNCELRIIRAKNLEFVSKGNLFVRYFLSTSNDTRVRLDSQEIPSTSEPYWNESTKLECIGAEDAMSQLKQQTVVFEIRWRTSTTFGIFGGSKLLFRAEVGWKDVLDSAELSIQKWVTSPTTSKFVPEGLKPPALQIEMKIQGPKVLPKRCHGSSTEWNKCGCRDGACNGRDEDIYAQAA
ncbi:nitric oxide synthase-interacting protein [Thalictrum thalictroides]|uniref:Nitric oxide synthase-interacting protein n=1 Tax=Thalictrum thalictroides TaxID=46969 RepID=A0A7J6VPA1_THATH|nr:nitric oxide synthase-interacting protein [Thalictrum thalictroides]